MGEDPRMVFKTLVTQAKDRTYYMFVVPVTGELDLKKAAAAVGEKSVSMVRSADLLAITGYVHGGCSPMCTKRPIRVTIDSTALDHPCFYVSAGKVGFQVEIATSDITKAMEAGFADIRA